MVPFGDKKPSQWDGEVTKSQKGALCDDPLLTRVCLPGARSSQDCEKPNKGTGAGDRPHGMNLRAALLPGKALPESGQQGPWAQKRQIGQMPQGLRKM